MALLAPDTWPRFENVLDDQNAVFEDQDAALDVFTKLIFERAFEVQNAVLEVI